MTFASKNLSTIKPYDGTLQVHTANGDTIPIAALGDISHPYHCIMSFVLMVCLKILLSVGQLVDDNCNVTFSSFGYVVQDRVSGSVITKEPKCGHFLLEIGGPHG